MKSIVIAYAGSLVAMLVLDSIWLGFIARNFYREQLGELMLPSPNLGAAAIFYLLYIAAVVILAVLPALNGGPIWPVLARGAVLGLAAYATYDLTNLATIKGWPAAMTLIDLGWGTVLTAIAAGAGLVVARYFS